MRPCVSQFVCVTTGQLYVAVQDVQDALAYAIHEFLLTVRDYVFRFGRLELVKGVLIRFHLLHRL